MDNENPVEDTSYLEAEKLENKGIGMEWRVLVAVIALLVIAVLVYPFISRQSNGTENQNQGIDIAGATPKTAEEHFKSGNSYAQKGEWERAIENYQAAIELDPEYQAAYANLGVIYYQMQKFEQAIVQYEKALELNPDDGSVSSNLGALYLQQALSGEQVDNNLLNKAVVELKHALKLSPNLAEPYFSLGVAYNALNQPEDAIKAFETFLENDAGYDPVASQQAQEYLKLLNGVVK